MKLYDEISDPKNMEEGVALTIWCWTNMGEFPSPHKLSRGCTRWKMEEVEQ